MKRRVCLLKLIVLMIINIEVIPNVYNQIKKRKATTFLGTVCNLEVLSCGVVLSSCGEDLSLCDKV